ncbi:LysR substrate-binding domain-containing protein [Achromobacter sp. F4_2707]|uniref:LysR family transcriptional regulator n=1 Tax=Achromobacter sp. F4_2707 TaxID=3114286 RepID=UPI0039C73F0B
MSSFDELVVFLRVVKDGSFSAAARTLGMSPSAVSKVIARLEQRLNVRLFERLGGMIRITQEGEILRESGQHVVDAMEEAENAVANPKAGVSGTVRIHTALTTAKYLIVPKLPALLERHPQLRIDFLLDTERGDFIRQGIDLAVHSGRPTELSLVGLPLMRRPWVIAAAPEYLRKYGTPQKPQELLNHRCLNFTIRTQWNMWTFVEDGELTTVDAPNYIGCNQGELLRTMALNGLGVVRLAEFHLKSDLEKGALIPLLREYQDFSEEDRFYLLYLKGRSIAPRVRAVIDFLKENFSE